MDDVGQLEEFYTVVQTVAHDLGLRPRPVEFHLVNAERIYELSSYYLPINVSHWSYGKAFWEQKEWLEKGHGRIYELVVNTNPAIAYLLDRNTLGAQKLVIAHVLGHADLYANHFLFQYGADTDTLGALNNIQRRMARYTEEHGEEAIEYILDCALSLQFNVSGIETHAHHTDPPAQPTLAPDLWDIFPVEQQKHSIRKPKYALPTTDLLDFLAKHSLVLDDWERDICQIVRQVGLILRPQLSSKIIHEGMATYAHHHILQDPRVPISPVENIEIAKLHAATTYKNPATLNPYNFGWKFIEWLVLEYGWVEARTILMTHSDSTLIRDYLTQDAANFMQLYLYRWDKIADYTYSRSKAYQATHVRSNIEELRDALANSMAIRMPVIAVDAIASDGTLVLRHIENTRKLNHAEAHKVAQGIATLWGAKVKIHDVDSNIIDAKPEHPFFPSKGE